MLSKDELPTLPEGWKWLSAHAGRWYARSAAAELWADDDELEVENFDVVEGRALHYYPVRVLFDLLYANGVIGESQYHELTKEG